MKSVYFTSLVPDLHRNMLVADSSILSMMYSREYSVLLGVDYWHGFIEFSEVVSIERVRSYIGDSRALVFDRHVFCVRPSGGDSFALFDGSSSVPMVQNSSGTNRPPPSVEVPERSDAPSPNPFLHTVSPIKVPSHPGVKDLYEYCNFDEEGLSVPVVDTDFDDVKESIPNNNSNVPPPLEPLSRTKSFYGPKSFGFDASNSVCVGCTLNNHCKVCASFFSDPFAVKDD